MECGGAGRRPAPVPSGIVTRRAETRQRLGEAANRARREAADGKKLEGERGHWLKCGATQIGSVTPVAGDRQLGVKLSKATVNTVRVM